MACAIFCRFPEKCRVGRRLLASLLLLASLSSPAVGYAQDVLTDLIGGGDASAQPVSDEPIAVESSAAQDTAIERRLENIFAELDALDAVEVEVSSGIVTLAGTADTVPAVERAVQIAGQVAGVVQVIDQMTVDTNVARRLNNTVGGIGQRFQDLLAALPVLLLALAVTGLFWWLGKLVGSRTTMFNRIAPNAFIGSLLSGIVRLLVTMAGVILALTLLDATSIIGTVLGAAGIISLAVGFAVRDTVENYIASILLSLRAPFLARDFVAINEHEGKVARLTSRATVLISLDGNHIRIPNAIVYKAVIVNYTRNPERRFEFVVGVDTDLELARAQQVAQEVIHAVPGVLAAPAAAALVTNLGDSSVTVRITGWIDQRTSDLQKVRSESIRQVKEAFDRAGIVMPEPIYRVNVNQRSALLSGGVGTAAAHDTSPEQLIISEGAGEATAPGSDVPQAPASTSPAMDTSADQSVEETLEREVHSDTSENLLGSSTVRE